jgi:hypothetical protein
MGVGRIYPNFLLWKGLINPNPKKNRHLVLSSNYIIHPTYLVAGLIRSP